jgi:hypothetical protein
MPSTPPRSSDRRYPIALPYGELRAVRARVPDTYFTMPARLRYQGRTIRGFLTIDTTDGPAAGAYLFTPSANPAACRACAPGLGCKRTD